MVAKWYAANTGEALDEFAQLARRVAGQGPLQVELVCPRGNISGEVTDANGTPAETAAISAVSTGIAQSNYTVNVHQAGGRFNIAVVPGRLLLTLPPAQPKAGPQ